eukprot:m.36336 g.36336  ORF g.36336 m.36336 type:complete len:107 (+) comp9980_c0_seq2:101-421(+)
MVSNIADFGCWYRQAFRLATVPETKLEVDLEVEALTALQSDFAHHLRRLELEAVALKTQLTLTMAEPTTAGASRSNRAGTPEELPQEAASAASGPHHSEQELNLAL